MSGGKRHNDLSAKVALMTRASRGLGAMVERHGKLNARVIVNFSSSEKDAHACGCWAVADLIEVLGFAIPSVARFRLREPLRDVRHVRFDRHRLPRLPRPATASFSRSGRHLTLLSFTCKKVLSYVKNIFQR